MRNLLLVLLILTPAWPQSTHGKSSAFAAASKAAQAHLAKHQYEQALTQAQKALAFCAAEPDTWIARGRAQLALGQTVPGFKSLREAGKRSRARMTVVVEQLLPGSSGLNRVALLYLLEKYEDCALQADQCSGPEASRWRGEARRKLRQFDAALQDFNQALSLAPNSYEALVSRGLLYRQLGKGSLALDDLNQASNLYRKEAEVCYFIGLILHEATGGGHEREALLEYQTAMVLDPLCADPFNARGSLIWSWRMDEEGLSEEDLHEALQSFQRAISLNPWVGEYYVNRGLVYYYNKMWKQAERDFAIALQRKPALAGHIETEKSKAGVIKSDIARARFEAWAAQQRQAEEAQRAADGWRKCSRCSGTADAFEDTCSACRYVNTNGHW